MIMKNYIHSVAIVYFLLSLLHTSFCGKDVMADGLPASEKAIAQFLPGKIDPYLATIAYSGGESLKFNVFWSGGIKIGELFLEITQSEQCDDCYEIGSKITSQGSIIDHLYPIEDVHITLVEGKERLPVFGEIWQKQGFNYRAHKIIHYNQQEYKIVKQKEGEAARTFELDGVVHNEFSSFFSSRIMNLDVSKPFLVPTFGDDKRHEVLVVTQKKEVLKKTLFGNVKTLKVMPILTFTGLYDKQGDTIIWYTDDECRVPVKIRSKIVIGTLTASLAQYKNPACPKYTEAVIQ